MIAYPDTSFLCAFYLKQSNSQAAAAHAATMKEPLHLTALLTYEFRQSLRFQVWRRAANPREGVALPDAQAALNQFEADLANGVAVLDPCNFHDVFQRAEALSARQPLGHLSNRKKRCRPILLNRSLPQLFRRALPADTNLRYRRLNRNTGQTFTRRGDPFSQPSGSSAF